LFFGGALGGAVAGGGDGVRLIGSPGQKYPPKKKPPRKPTPTPAQLPAASATSRGVFR
jgi:hypothetical protein